MVKELAPGGLMSQAKVIWPLIQAPNTKLEAYISAN
jgi:hypothetical protein